MQWLVFWLGLSLIAAIIAVNKGRSGAGFFLLALLLSPVVGILAALIVKPNVGRVEEKMLADGEVRCCPYCAELIKPEAIICKHCGRNLHADTSSPTEEQWDRFVSAIEKRPTKSATKQSPPK